MLIRGLVSLRSEGAESNPFSIRVLGMELAYWYSSTVLGVRCKSADPNGLNAFTRPMNWMVCSSLPNLSSRMSPTVIRSEVISDSAWSAELCWLFTSGEVIRRTVNATVGSNPLLKWLE